MSWRDRQRQMIVELNEKVFSRDPLRVMRESYNSIDVVNSNYIIFVGLKMVRIGPGILIR